MSDQVTEVDAAVSEVNQDAGARRVPGQAGNGATSKAQESGAQRGIINAELVPRNSGQMPAVRAPGAA